MALNGWFQPKFMQNHMGKKLVNMSSDTFEVGLIASGTLAARGTTEGYEYVSDLLNNNGSALTEVATGGGTNYTRLALSSESWTVSGLVVTFTGANPLWTPSVTFTTVYAWIYDETASSGTDATRPLLFLYDLGGAQSPSAQPFQLTINGSGLWTDTASQ